MNRWVLLFIVITASCSLMVAEVLQKAGYHGYADQARIGVANLNRERGWVLQRTSVAAGDAAERAALEKESKRLVKMWEEAVQMARARAQREAKEARRGKEKVTEGKAGAKMQPSHGAPWEESSHRYP